MGDFGGEGSKSFVWCRSTAVEAVEEIGVREPDPSSIFFMCGVVMEERRVDDDSSGLGGRTVWRLFPWFWVCCLIVAGKNLVGGSVPRLLPRKV
jgi:hypothetical protein